MRLNLISLLLLWLCAMPGAASAAQDGAIFEGEAEVASQSEAHRNAALPRALAQVIAKVTGNPQAASDPAIASALGQAAGMLQQYRYREDVATRRLYLIARFDHSAVENLLADAGGVVWPSPRPRPLLWLAIDDGRGARLLGEAQVAVVTPLTQRAAERGLTFGFPLADVQDQAAAGAEAVWNNDTAAVRVAAARYGNEPVLIGKLQRGGALWSGDWVLLDESSVLKRWSTVNADAGVVLAAAADDAATALAQRYAKRILSGPAGDHDILVSGLDRADDYARVLRYLTRLPIVREVQPLSAGGDRIAMRLSLSSGLEGLLRLAASGGVLRALPTPAGEAVQFQLEP